MGRQADAWHELGSLRHRHCSPDGAADEHLRPLMLSHLSRGVPLSARKSSHSYRRGPGYPFRPGVDQEVSAGHPGIAGHGVAQGVQGVDAVVAGGAEVGADEAVPGGGADAAPAAADLHLELDHALRLFGGVVRPSRRLHVMRRVGGIRIWCGSRTGSIRCPAARLSS